MKCPHCLIEFHDEWVVKSIEKDHFGNSGALKFDSKRHWRYKHTRCPSCRQHTLYVHIYNSDKGSEEYSVMVYPKNTARRPVSDEVPVHLATDYMEACSVLSASPKSSAALSRRCLQNILNDKGYRNKNLAGAIDDLLNEKDTTKSIPSRLRITIDGIRNFGNFSAHPITDISTSQIIDVDEHEAEWCLEIIEEMFDHFYVQPAIARQKKADLDAKLAAAGKPLSKG